MHAWRGSVRSSGEEDDARLAEEYDSTKRATAVYLFTRPIDQILPDTIHYHHWALVFKFQGDDVRTVEGFQDQNQKLYPRYTKSFPVENGNYYDICEGFTSPTDVLQAAVSNRCNDTDYIATWQNCQTWVKEMAYSMGSVLAVNIDNFHTLKQANPLLAISGRKKNASGFGSCSR